MKVWTILSITLKMMKNSIDHLVVKIHLLATQIIHLVPSQMGLARPL